MSKALIDYQDEELEEALRATASHVQYSYNDYVGEINRRAALRQARRSELLSVVSAGVAIIAVLIAAASFVMAP